MAITFLSGLIILAIALALQFFSGSAGMFLNFSFAALIAFAFLFEFWELVCFVLIAVFVLDWQPAASVEILVFALYPIAVYFFRKTIPWQHWIAAPAAIILGFAVLAFAAAPALFFAHLSAFFTDTIAGLAFGALIFYPLRRWGK
jgi:hypothetical protein